MVRQAIWMLNGSGADPAIQRGLAEAGCNVVCTHGITETLSQLREMPNIMESEGVKKGASSVVLVAEVQAGAIPLLMLLREQGMEVPPTLVFDRDGSDVRPAIRALQLGAREYCLASDSELNRELCACVLVEREPHAADYPADMPRASKTAHTVISHGSLTRGEMHWDMTSHVIRVDKDDIPLSPIEARIFNLLFENRGQVVTVEDLINKAMRKAKLEPMQGARQLRPHMMRLRRKLNQYPQVANRILNTRGTGYMLV
jgi:DNA-binding response OmpR family regulator